MGLFDKLSKKVTPEVALDKDFQAAKEDVIKRIKEQENVTFFNRQFIIPVRNFFHAIFPTVTLFKSPFELAFEKFLQFRDRMSQDRAREKMNAEMQIGEALQDFVIDVIEKNNNELSLELRRYIAIEKSFLAAKYDPLGFSVYSEAWTNVRNCMNTRGKISPALDDVLFKLNILYPRTVAHNNFYEEQKKPQAFDKEPKHRSSQFTMYNLGLGRGSSAEKTQSFSFEKSFCFPKLWLSVSKKPSSQEQFDDAVAGIQERINNLNKQGENGSCCWIFKIKGLQSNLNNLLNKKLTPSIDLRTIELHNSLITKHINDATINLSNNNVKVKIDWTVELDKSKTILRNLLNDINALKCDNNLSEKSDEYSDTLRL